MDSLSFRNKQLEHRIEVLQDFDDKKSKILSNKLMKIGKNDDSMTGNSNKSNGSKEIDPVVLEELQNRIMENAKLGSMIADKNNDIEMLTNRIKELENQLNRQLHENSDVEKKLRQEIEKLTHKNSELETKLVEATSTLGSEDGLSVTDSDCGTSMHIVSSSSHERIASLEKELNYYRTQYEIMKINDVLKLDEHLMQPSQNTKSAVPENDPNSNEINRIQIMYDYFSKRFDELFLEKCKAESKVTNFENECESLKNNLKITITQLTDKEKMHLETQLTIKLLEEDFNTTRENYEEHIKVLSEQIISLSDQLAASR